MRPWQRDPSAAEEQHGGEAGEPPEAVGAGGDDAGLAVEALGDRVGQADRDVSDDPVEVLGDRLGGPFSSSSSLRRATASRRHGDLWRA